MLGGGGAGSARGKRPATREAGLLSSLGGAPRVGHHAGEVQHVPSVVVVDSGSFDTPNIRRGFK